MTFRMFRWLVAGVFPALATVIFFAYGIMSGVVGLVMSVLVARYVVKAAKDDRVGFDVTTLLLVTFFAFSVSLVPSFVSQQVTVPESEQFTVEAGWEQRVVDRHVADNPHVAGQLDDTVAVSDGQVVMASHISCYIFESTGERVVRSVLDDCPESLVAVRGVTPGEVSFADGLVTTTVGELADWVQASIVAATFLLLGMYAFGTVHVTGRYVAGRNAGFPPTWKTVRLMFRPSDNQWGVSGLTVGAKSTFGFHGTEAVCHLDGEHTSPEVGCECGFWSVWQYGQARVIQFMYRWVGTGFVAKTQAFGKTLQFKKGVRSQRQHVLYLYPRRFCSKPLCFRGSSQFTLMEPQRDGWYPIRPTCDLHATEQGHHIPVSRFDELNERLAVHKKFDVVQRDAADWLAQSGMTVAPGRTMRAYRKVAEVSPLEAERLLERHLTVNHLEGMSWTWVHAVLDNAALQRVDEHPAAACAVGLRPYPDVIVLLETLYGKDVVGQFLQVWLAMSPDVRARFPFTEMCEHYGTMSRL